MSKSVRRKRKRSRSDAPRDGLPRVITVKMGQTWDPKLGRMRPQSKAERADFERQLATFLAPSFPDQISDALAGGFRVQVLNKLDRIISLLQIVQRGK